MSSSRIIVGVDGSEHSIRAVQWCAAHAADFDAEVVAVHVIDAPRIPE
jgi:nucleotide-binding universal stress UspA family protein